MCPALISREGYRKATRRTIWLQNTQRRLRVPIDALCSRGRAGVDTSAVRQPNDALQGMGDKARIGDEGKAVVGTPSAALLSLLLTGEALHKKQVKMVSTCSNHVQCGDAAEIHFTATAPSILETVD
jgi:hypothetical protein